MKTSILVHFILLSSILTACSAGSHGPQPYKPADEREASLLEKANLSVYPYDVRKAPQKYANTLVRWSGVISGVKYRLGATSQIAILQIKHRYFDWIEDSGSQPEKYFLSPKGEGDFALAWVDDLSEDAFSFLREFEKGDMIIAYGYPSEIKGQTIGLVPVKYIRSFDPQYFRSDIAEYGRPGEPVRVLRRIR